MQYIIKGKIRDSEGKGLGGLSVNAFDKDPLSDEFLGSSLTDDDGHFEIAFASKDFDRFHLEGAPEVYLKIIDVDKSFKSVKDKQGSYTKDDKSENMTWNSSIINSINDIDKYDITIVIQPRKIPDEYEAVVIGSGFGGTITSLTLANKFGSEDPTHKSKRVCILERGQWWVSHEIPTTTDGIIGTNPSPTLPEYLERNNVPYNTWAYPDNTKGLLRLFGTIRIFDNIKGLYDYKAMRNVHVVTGSGVGGGSLVYFNITERPESSVYQKWPTETNEQSIANYFSYAENFIGTNSITTTTSNGTFKLLRTKAFQNAAKIINIEENNEYEVMNNIKSDGSLDLDARLSITEIEPQVLFSKGGPLGLEKKLEEMSKEELGETFKKFLDKYKRETNVCQRQGRCGLGCIPGARHSLNKQIYKAIAAGKPLDVFPLCKVDHIEHIENTDSEYKYRIILKDYRDLEKGMDKVINAKQVILSAGTLGSTEILLRSKGLELSDNLGTSFSTNGDTFGVINRTKENVDSSRGPMQTSLAKFRNKKTGEFEFSIEDLGIPKMFAEILPIMFNLMALQKKAGSFLPQINLIDMVRGNILPIINKSNTRQLMSGLLSGLHISPGRIGEEIVELLIKVSEFTLDKNVREESLREQSLDERVRNIMLLFGIGLDNANGQLTINDKNNELDLVNDYELDDEKQPIIKSITDMMKSFAKQIGQDGEDSLIMPFWDSNNSRQQITAHPLGGCPMGEDATTAVVNSFGEVFRGKSGKNVYEHLYVADGSIIPSSLGVNPSLTISALAFRISEHITGSREYWPH